MLNTPSRYPKTSMPLPHKAQYNPSLNTITNSPTQLPGMSLSPTVKVSKAEAQEKMKANQYVNKRQTHEATQVITFNCSSGRSEEN